MLDIKLIRDNPKIVKESQKKRGLDDKEVDIILELDEKWRKLKQEVDGLRAERNRISERINEAKKQGKPINEIIKKAKELPEEIKEKEEEMNKIEGKKNSILENLPNLIFLDLYIKKFKEKLRIKLI